MTNANLTTAQPITRQQIGRALHEARRTYAQAPRVLNAFNRAALELEASPWQWDGRTLRITSASEAAEGQRYWVTEQGCTCKAAQYGTPCRHAAARALLVTAARYQPAPSPAARPIRDSQAEADELFG